MKYLFVITFLFLINSSLKSQSTTENRSVLIYAPEIPNESTYKIEKNIKNLIVSDVILEQINFHRRSDEDYLWKVSEDLEILIYKINKVIER